MQYGEKDYNLDPTEYMTLIWAQCYSEGTFSHFNSVDETSSGFLTVLYTVSVESYTEEIIVMSFGYYTGALNWQRAMDWDISGSFSLYNSHVQSNNLYILGSTISYRNINVDLDFIRT